MSAEEARDFTIKLAEGIIGLRRDRISFKTVGEVFRLPKGYERFADCLCSQLIVFMDGTELFITPIKRTGQAENAQLMYEYRLCVPEMDGRTVVVGSESLSVDYFLQAADKFLKACEM